jgi:hypothetical protein
MQFILFILDEDYRLCVTSIIHQQLWGYKVEDKLYLGVREQKRLNTTGLDDGFSPSARVTSCEICGGRSATVAGFCQSSFDFFLLIIIQIWMLER